MISSKPGKNARRFIDEIFAATVSDSTETAFPTSEARVTGAKGPTRIMYIENKTDGNGLTGPARIGRVSFSKTGKMIYYRGGKFRSLKGAGFKSNYAEIHSGDRYWISGPKRNGQDALYGGSGAEIDEDCRQEYWTQIRQQPNRSREKTS
jgi:hypothetical protein